MLVLLDLFPHEDLIEKIKVRYKRERSLQVCALEVPGNE